MVVGPGSSKKIGRYRISLGRPLGVWNNMILSIYVDNDKLPFYRKTYSNRSAISLYKRLDSAGKIEGLLMR